MNFFIFFSLKLKFVTIIFFSSSFSISLATTPINFPKSIEFLEVMTGLPVSCSISFLAFPAMLPHPFISPF